ncbi:hypothetical protein PUN4_540051 [Paraburkholderia unamae]|nr:hypothetical protein PUN4_540051 [Paraburkholderia unamae]
MGHLAGRSGLAQASGELHHIVLTACDSLAVVPGTNINGLTRSRPP